mgnify:CR=1 FL=1
MENTGGLYRSEYEHDACGVGFIAHIKGQKLSLIHISEPTRP